MYKYRVVVFAAGRPDFARLAPIIRRMDEDDGIHCIFINSGQHAHTPNLDKAFRENLGLREPDHNLNIGKDGADWHEQIAQIFQELVPILMHAQPDAFINLGDMNPCISGLVAKRLGIKYIRIECGMRSGKPENAYKNWELPEEVNRVAMDSIADLKLVYTPTNENNLLHEGHTPDSIKVVGNTIIETLDHYCQAWDIKPERGNYDFVSLHRGDNLNERTLPYFIDLLDALSLTYNKNMKFVCYGRTRKLLEESNLIYNLPDNVEILDPLNQEDFLRLIAGCDIILSDSGSTGSEESHYFHKPALILRDSTERPDTIMGRGCLCDCNAILWKKDLDQDIYSYDYLCKMPRDWNNRFYDSPNGEKISKNIIEEVKKYLWTLSS